MNEKHNIIGCLRAFIYEIYLVTVWTIITLYGTMGFVDKFRTGGLFL